ncbi:MAG TPA: hypothetical protein GX405_18825 [Rhizobiales bacterium]|nr:hypothetical protein [Hyphomicrobiales bacterium]
MIGLLTITAALVPVMSAAGACERMRSAAAGIGKTTAASTIAAPMSAPVRPDATAAPEVSADSEG